MLAVVVSEMDESSVGWRSPEALADVLGEAGDGGQVGDSSKPSDVLRPDEDERAPTSLGLEGTG